MDGKQTSYMVVGNSPCEQWWSPWTKVVEVHVGEADGHIGEIPQNELKRPGNGLMCWLEEERSNQ